jgi:LmbE family N-acetylglucosaminyl deacetylase
MTVVYILAHFDDEYCAWPLIREAARAGQAQAFLYLADYRDAALGARRLRETHAFLAGCGLPAQTVRPIGLGTGAYDQSLHQRVADLHAAARRTIAPLGTVEHLVVPAWEGGHMDHDTCAWIAARLGAELGVPVRQFSLYNGPGLPGPLLRAGAPLAQNGPCTPIRLPPKAWLWWLAAVRAFPSQLYAWSGIWPAMVLGLARRGFGWQSLAPGRVLERPHPGSLFYERMFGVSYQAVRAALDAGLPAQPAA